MEKTKEIEKFSFLKPLIEEINLRMDFSNNEIITKIYAVSAEYKKDFIFVITNEKVHAIMRNEYLVFKFNEIKFTNGLVLGQTKFLVTMDGKTKDFNLFLAWEIKNIEDTEKGPRKDFSNKIPGNDFNTEMKTLFPYLQFPVKFGMTYRIESHLNYLRSILGSNEEVLFLFCGQSKLWNSTIVCAVTSKDTIVIASKSITNWDNKIKRLFLKDIHEVSIQRERSSAIVEIETMTEKFPVDMLVEGHAIFVSEILLTYVYDIRNEAGKLNARSVYPAISPTDELLKYKQLLDAQVITQEEFDKKKKQLLDI